MYTKYTLFLYFSDFSKNFIFMKNKMNNQNMLNKAKHKTRCKCMKKEEEKRRSIHGDNTNVLAKEFKPFAIKRFGEQISLLIINMNELKSESTIFDKLLN